MKLPSTKYFGKTRHLRALENYHLSFSYHSVGETIPRHHHENPYFSLNLGSAYLEDSFSSKEIIKPGNVVVRPSGFEHQNTFTHRHGLCFNVEFVSDSNLSLLHLLIEKNIEFSCLEFLQILSKVDSDYLDDELDCYITELLIEKLEPKPYAKLHRGIVWLLTKSKQIITTP